ncbi:hypothetical protein Dsin_021759 [Dipteronia sinensis]|uniref:DUF4283 domain-containing protein n=1 Tax=Dipteronia sinensis TaxID=43782 RepID=A0AAE0A0S9_9ROSI|nr:hypothetical protein Dsin_021759 [Dipteronia sinensis]
MDPPSSRPMNLKYYQPFHSGNRKCVSPPLEVAENGSKAWKNCLVGYFIEKKVTFSLVNNIAMRIWGNRGLLEVLANEKGFYFFKFSDDETYSNELEAGSWLFAGRMVILKKWHSRLILSKDSYSKILVLVKLFNIPHEYWNEEGLSHIAGAIGKPLYADSLTESMKRISFARVCIEIDASCDLVDSFDLFMGDSSNPKLGENMEILVEYQWKPKICTECKSFGHSITNCPKLKPLLSPSKNVSAPKLKQERRRVNKRDAPTVCSPQACMEPPLFGSLKDDEVISTCNTKNEPSWCPSNLPNHDQCQDLSMERAVDTSNKFAALVEEGDNRNDQCNDQSNDQCNDVDPPSMASPD